MLEKRLKLAHLTLSMNPGGLERLIVDLTACSIMQDVEFVVICLDEPGVLASQLETSGVKIILEKRKPGLDLGLIWRMARVFRREHIGALHTHSLDPMLYGGIGAVLGGVPKRFHTQHNVHLREAGWMQRLKFRIASRFFTRIIGVSEETRRTAIELGAPAGRCVTILNGVDCDRFTEPAVSQKRSGEWVFGTVARLSREKGVHKLLEAFGKVSQQHPQSRLYIVGDGPERQALEKLAAASGIEGSVTFCGYQQNVHDFLRRFDVFVLPSLTEAVPMALLEAMAAGLPVLATSVGGVPEVVVHNESGFLVPPGDAESLSSAMISLMSDSDRRQEMGKRAQCRIRDCFSQSSMARSYRSLYLADRKRTVVASLGSRGLGLLPRRSILWQGPRHGSTVSLTFDDGPEPVYTPRVLEILQRYGVKATFFLTGEKAAREPALVREILAQGHELANHSYTHAKFERLSIQHAIREVRQAQSTIESLQGRRCRLFRPPYGKLCAGSLLAAWLERMTIVLWNRDFKDYLAQCADDVEKRLPEDPILPGDIVLYHGITEASVAALPGVLEHIKKQGYTSVPVSVLWEQRA